MALDVTELLAPVSEDNPVGENLEYDPRRGVIVEAFAQASALTAGPAAEIDWRPIVAAIEALSAKTKDIWLPVYLARAGARMGDLSIVETGLAYLDGMVETYWADLYPKLDDLGVLGRTNACDTLGVMDGGVSAEFVRPLQKAVLIADPRFGRYSLLDLQRFAANREAEADYGAFRAAVEALSDAEMAAIGGRLERMAALLASIETRVEQAAADETISLGYSGTIAAVQEMRRAFLALRPGSSAAPEASASMAAGQAVDRPGAATFSHAIDNREQVVRAIDAICDYYRRREPGSPVLIALQRARDWVDLDFLTLLEDIAPSSLDTVNLVLKSQRTKPE